MLLDRHFFQSVALEINIPADSKAVVRVAAYAQAVDLGDIDVVGFAGYYWLDEEKKAPNWKSCLVMVVS